MSTPPGPNANECRRPFSSVASVAHTDGRSQRPATVLERHAGEVLADEEFVMLEAKSEFLFVNYGWATYYLTDELPSEMMKMWTEMAVAYA